MLKLSRKHVLHNNFCRFPLFTFRWPGPKPQWRVSVHQKCAGATWRNSWKFASFFFVDKTLDPGWFNSTWWQRWHWEISCWCSLWLMQAEMPAVQPTLPWPKQPDRQKRPCQSYPNIFAKPTFADQRNPATPPPRHPATKNPCRPCMNEIFFCPGCWQQQLLAVLQEWPMHSFQSFSNQAAIDPTAYRENRIKQLKEAGGLGSSIRVFLCNLRFERMKPFD